MKRSPTEASPTPRSIAAFVKTNAARAKKAQQMHHGESMVTREADYKGHHIVVHTTYEVEVDGKSVMGHIGVNDLGLVHYHPIPNLRFDSALDMVKKIIDVFPDDFGPDSPSSGMPGMHHASLAESGKAAKKETPKKKIPAVKRKLAKKKAAKSVNKRRK